MSSSLHDRMTALAGSVAPEADAVPVLVAGVARRRRRRRAASAVAVVATVVALAGVTASLRGSAPADPDRGLVADPAPPGATATVPDAPETWAVVYDRVAGSHLDLLSSVRFPDGGGRAVLGTDDSYLVAVAIERFDGAARAVCATHAVAGTTCVARADGAWVDRWLVDGRTFPGFAPLHPDDVTRYAPTGAHAVRGVSRYTADGHVVTIVSRPCGYCGAKPGLDALEAAASSPAWLS